MCAVSFVGDHYTKKWQDYTWDATGGALFPQVTKQEFDALRKEVQEMKELLLRAKKYDEETGQPDCEMDTKVELLKKMADAFGISLEEVFGKKKRK